LEGESKKERKRKVEPLLGFREKGAQPNKGHCKRTIEGRIVRKRVQSRRKGGKKEEATRQSCKGRGTGEFINGAITHDRLCNLPKRIAHGDQGGGGKATIKREKWIPMAARLEEKKKHEETRETDEKNKKGFREKGKKGAGLVARKPTPSNNSRRRGERHLERREGTR